MIFKGPGVKFASWGLRPGLEFCSNQLWRRRKEKGREREKVTSPFTAWSAYPKWRSTGRLYLRRFERSTQIGLLRARFIGKDFSGFETVFKTTILNLKYTGDNELSKREGTFFLSLNCSLSASLSGRPSWWAHSVSAGRSKRVTAGKLGSLLAFLLPSLLNNSHRFDFLSHSMWAWVNKQVRNWVAVHSMIGGSCCICSSLNFDRLIRVCLHLNALNSQFEHTAFMQVCRILGSNSAFNWKTKQPRVTKCVELLESTLRGSNPLGKSGWT